MEHQGGGRRTAPGFLRIFQPFARLSVRDEAVDLGHRFDHKAGVEGIDTIPHAIRGNKGILRFQDELQIALRVAIIIPAENLRGAC